MRERLEEGTRGAERLHLPGAHLPGAVRAVRASVDAQGELATDAEVRHGVDEARPRLGRLELLHQLHERALRASLRGRGHAELDRVHPACGGDRRWGRDGNVSVVSAEEGRVERGKGIGHERARHAQ